MIKCPYCGRDDEIEDGIGQFDFYCYFCMKPFNQPQPCLEPEAKPDEGSHYREAYEENSES